jgi:hypothetical protein
MEKGDQKRGVHSGPAPELHAFIGAPPGLFVSDLGYAKAVVYTVRCAHKLALSPYAFALPGPQGAALAS